MVQGSLGACLVRARRLRQVVKAVVASAVNNDGEELYPRKWNAEFIDMAIVHQSKQNTPSFTGEVMSGLARWKHSQARIVFVLCGATGMRIGEALGLEIDKHISSDFQTISIKQKARHCAIENRLNAVREVDLHSSIAILCARQAPSSSCVEAAWLHQPDHRNRQGGNPRVQAISEHLSQKSHGVSVRPLQVLAGTRPRGFE